MLGCMSALPKFFILAALAGAALWLADAPYPFPLLAKFIVACSVAGFILSAAYVHAFMPWVWDAKLARMRRLRDSMFHLSAH